MISLVIWDFNGTIADDVALSMSSINAILESRSLPTLKSVGEYRANFCFPIEKYYQNVGLDFSREPYKIPADEWVASYTAGMDEVPLSGGVRETICEIKEKGIPQIILSASEKSMLMHQLNGYSLTEFFDEILGTGDVYGVGKVEIARSWAAQKQPGILKNAVFIGDTDHDKTTADAIGCGCILYSGGHMSRETLSRLGVPVVDNIREITKIIFDE